MESDGVVVATRHSVRPGARAAPSTVAGNGLATPLSGTCRSLGDRGGGIFVWGALSEILATQRTRNRPQGKNGRDDVKESTAPAGHLGANAAARGSASSRRTPEQTFFSARSERQGFGHCGVEFLYGVTVSIPGFRAGSHRSEAVSWRWITLVIEPQFLSDRQKPTIVVAACPRCLLDAASGRQPVNGLVQQTLE